MSDLIKPLIENTSKLLRHVYPGFVAILFFNLIIYGIPDGLFKYSQAIMQNILLAIAIGPVIYSIYKVLFNVYLYSTKDWSKRSLDFNSLGPEERGSFDYQWSLIHLTLISCFIAFALLIIKRIKLKEITCHMMVFAGGVIGCLVITLFAIYLLQKRQDEYVKDARERSVIKKREIFD